MDWMIFGVMASVAAVFFLWKVHSTKREAELFADQVEKALDDILSGREVDFPDVSEDTLWGKVSEKLGRTEKIWKQKEEQSKSEKEKMKELIGDISHQTKTPIANMKIYLELLEDEEVSPKARAFAAQIGRQTDKLEFLVQSMIKMSRLETGAIQIKKEKADIFDTITKAVAMVVPKAAKKDICMCLEEHSKLFVYHDRKWMEEAVFNVLDNAVKYTEENGRIEVFVKEQEFFIKILVKDSGKGIAEERQAQIFARFYREPEVHDQEGIGVGLYLTRKILELQGGYIEVHSEIGKGSEFCLYLPNER